MSGYDVVADMREWWAKFGPTREELERAASPDVDYRVRNQLGATVSEVRAWARARRVPMSADGIAKGAVRAFTSTTWPHGLEWSIKVSAGGIGPKYVFMHARAVDRIVHPDAPPTEQEHDITIGIDPDAVPDDVAEGYGFAVASQCVMDIANRMGKRAG